ncbi:hypothetical protein DW765_04705 [Phocaeicola vulgatus]|nr:hypothetical protein DW765_04705 [Phocaeicola vulgatus]
MISENAIYFILIYLCVQIINVLFMTRKNEQERFMSYITERQTHESRMAVADFLRKSQLKKQKMTE